MRLTGYAIDSPPPAWCNWTDINRDGLVGVGDLSIFTSNYNRSGCSSLNVWCNYADIDRNGWVNVGDLSLLSIYYNRVGCNDGTGGGTGGNTTNTTKPPVTNTTNTSLPSCFDPDAGVNAVYNKSVVARKSSTGYQNNYGDVCVSWDVAPYKNLFKPVSNGLALLEYSCSGTNAVSDYYSCSCVNGACVSGSLKGKIVNRCNSLNSSYISKIRELRNGNFTNATTILIEGERVDKRGYFVVGEGNFNAGILRVSTITNSTSGYASDGVVFSDILNFNSQYNLYITAEGKGTFSYRGNTYDVLYSKGYNDDGYVKVSAYPYNELSTYLC